MLTALYVHVLITAVLAALFGAVVLTQYVAAVVRSAGSRPVRRDRPAARHRPSRVVDSRF